MKNRIFILSAVLLALGINACTAQQQDERKNPYYKPNESAKVEVKDAAWKKVLAPKVYNIMREKGTEAANSGPYVHNDKKGMYYCAACGNALFTSANKYDSHTGWPSFYQPLNNASVKQQQDADGSGRDEVVCARCGGHLGHVFDDGPAPTNMRYCMNGYALHFEEGKEK